MSQTGGRSTGRQKQAFKNRCRLVSERRGGGGAVGIACVNIQTIFVCFEHFRFALLAES
jgi:hypothetical protein